MAETKIIKKKRKDFDLIIWNLLQIQDRRMAISPIVA